jgi:hypothetical protein
MRDVHRREPVSRAKQVPRAADRRAAGPAGRRSAGRAPSGVLRLPGRPGHRRGGPYPEYQPGTTAWWPDRGRVPCPRSAAPSWNPAPWCAAIFLPLPDREPGWTAMTGMKVTVDAAMRARDVSRPHAEHEAQARERDAQAVGAGPPGQPSRRQAGQPARGGPPDPASQPGRAGQPASAGQPGPASQRSRARQPAPQGQRSPASQPAQPNRAGQPAQPNRASQPAQPSPAARQGPLAGAAGAKQEGRATRPGASEPPGSAIPPADGQPAQRAGRASGKRRRRRPG